MNPLRFLISVTIHEFEVLRNLGTLRVEPARLIVTPASSEQGFGQEIDAQVLAKLPEFRPSEDHSVLVLAFDGWESGPPVVEPLSLLLSGRVALSASHCRRIFPLTARARSLLAGRLQGQVSLSEPIFEDIVSVYLRRLETISSHSGAQAVVDAVVANPGDFPMDHLRSIADQPDHSSAKLLQAMLSYTRHKPRPPEPISGLADLGTVLKESNTGDPSQLSQLGEWLRPRLERTAGFKAVYKDSGLLGILERITRAWDLPASASAFSIFLHWRDLALRAAGVDLEAVALDCQELAGCIDGRVIVEALWLLGFSSGYDAVAPGCYRRMGEKHPFNTSGRSGKRVTLLSIPRVAVPEPAVIQQPVVPPPAAATREPGTGEDKPAPEKEGDGDTIKQPDPESIDKEGTPAVTPADESANHEEVSKPTSMETEAKTGSGDKIEPGSDPDADQAARKAPKKSTGKNSKRGEEKSKKTKSKSESPKADENQEVKPATLVEEPPAPAQSATPAPDPKPADGEFHLESS